MRFLVINPRHSPSARVLGVTKKCILRKFFMFRPSSRRRFSDANLSLLSGMLALCAGAALIFGIDTLSAGFVRTNLRAGVGAVLSALPQGSITGIFAREAQLREENAALMDALLRVEEERTRFSALVEENALLREMAQLAMREDVGISAPVISSFSSSPYGTFVIGVGEGDGVHTDDIVLSPGGYVLGIIVNAQRETATVETLFAPQKSREMMVGDIAFLAEGRGGGNARGEIPREAFVQKGAVVITPEFFGRPAGVVGEMLSSPSSAVSTLFIRVPTNLDTLRYVYVIPAE